MPNPFTTTALPVRPTAAPVSPEVTAAREALAIAEGTSSATDNQINFIAKLLGERDWHQGSEKYVLRAAALNVVIGWALHPMADATPAEISRLVNNSVGRLTTYGLRVNVILAHLARVTESSNAANYGQLTKAGASTLIELLLSLPKRETPAERDDRFGESVSDLPSAEEVPAGRYAVETEDGATNALAFYKVDRPTEGKWAGHVFVKLVVSDEEQRMSRVAARAVLAKIAEVGAEAASARYGHEIGRCGVCDRTLTNDVSRARGIGPICAGNMGW